MQDTDFILDVRGLTCPMPLLKAKQKLNQMNTGEVLKVIATDPGSVRDFGSFISLTKNQMLQEEHSDGVYTYLIQKVA